MALQCRIMEIMKQTKQKPSIALLAACTFVIALITSMPAAACDTPVYRYAMYNWATAPYMFYYFHDGTPAGEDEETNLLLVELAESEPPLNVVFTTVDLSQDEPLEQLPEPVKQCYRSHADGDVPRYLVVTPWGAELFAGRLDTATVRAMVQSPIRTRLGELLTDGATAVLLILTGPDDAENRRAEQLAAELSERNAAGKIELLKLSRTDPAERWLVRSLLVVEPDLYDYPDTPMIFAAYGRGRVMPPYVGKGINADNLAECIAFLSGACSCMVKSQNPGMDLLVQWDWESAADTIAATDETFDGDVPRLEYQEFAVDEAGNTVEATPPLDEKLEGKVEISGVAGGRAEGDAPAVPPHRSALPRPPDALPRAFAARQAWKLGIGVLVGTIVVLAAGFVISKGLGIRD